MTDDSPLKFLKVHTGEPHLGDAKVRCINCFNVAWLCQYKGPQMPDGAAFPGICSFDCYTALNKMELPEFIDKTVQFMELEGLGTMPEELVKKMKEDTTASGLLSALDKTKDSNTHSRSFTQGEPIKHESMTDDNGDPIDVFSIPVSLRLSQG